MTVPEGAQLSEDGNYWWDGAEWQSVPSGDAGGGGGGGGGGGDLAGALAAQGIPIAAEAAEAGYVQQMTEHVGGWYGGLDGTDQAIVDALSAEGCDGVLADPEVGVVSEGDPLITAFAANDMTLGQSLQATNQALEQATS
jgi:hypothetical protein